LKIISGQRCESLAVDRQNPARQETGVKGEQAGGIC
jgi:hypothetical protein